MMLGVVDRTKVVPVLPTTPNIKKRAQDISKKMKIPDLLTKVCTYRTQKKASNRCPCLTGSKITIMKPKRNDKGVIQDKGKMSSKMEQQYKLYLKGVSHEF